MKRREHSRISPASIADSCLRSHRLNTSRNFTILRSCSHVVRFMIHAPLQSMNRTTRVLPNPDNSCAPDITAKSA